jgi:CRISPR-associated protein Cmr6
MALELSPGVNVVSYLRYKLLKLVYERRGEVTKDDLNRLGREVMLKIEEAFRCEALTPLFRAVDSHMDRVVRALEALGYAAIYDRRLGLMTRLAIHLRSPYTSPLELGISWDPYWNLPYIPATSLKGAIRSTAELTHTNCLKDLGTLEEASSIVVLDAYPILCPHGRSLVTVDIINPHYREVEGKVSEVESSPTPLAMLTVTSGTAFRIAILATKRKRPACTEEALSRLVSEALRRGIGAKTSLGYGMFSVIY